MKAQFLKELLSRIPDNADVLVKTSRVADAITNHEIRSVVREYRDPSKKERITNVLVEI